ncbi:rubredoxin-type Fe(Cys)4 protein [Desulforhopalus sp. IMCC35007]|nr:rubredoxin-type Fe(Cys)4 protein [Desulforhopalus sp. IMCC35007]
MHQGDQAPDKCPLCGADKSLFVEIDAEGEVIGGDDDPAVSASGSPAAASGQTAPTSTFFDMISNLILKFHLHPIHTHFPNGILPVLVIFLGLSMYLKIAALEAAAFFNAIAVLIMLPAVIGTGYVEWQKRYRGIKSAIFITKIVCSLIVLGSVNVLVFWRIIDPGVATEGSPSQLIYFAVAAIALAAAGIAGHLGGKLVFASRS